MPSFFVDIDDYQFNVYVAEHHFSPKYKGSVYNCPSDLDYYGEESIRFYVDSISVYNEKDNKMVVMQDKDEALEVYDAYVDKIEDKLLDMIHNKGEDDD